MLYAHKPSYQEAISYCLNSDCRLVKFFFAFVNSVSFHVPLQVLGFVAGVGALLASKRFFVSVDHYVDLETEGSIARIVTFLTLERFLSCVD